MKCQNCDDIALYVYSNPSVSPLSYCNAHLPSFARPLVKSGLIGTTDAYEDSKREVLAALADTSSVPPATGKRRRSKRESSIVTTVEEPISENSTADGTTMDGTEEVVELTDDEATDTE